MTIASANGFAQKKLDTASQSLQVRNERRERKGIIAEAREYRAAERGLQAELRESDRRIKLMWRGLKTKTRPEKTLRHTPPAERTRKWPYASRAPPKYDGPVLDRRGERGVFMRVRYYSRRTAGAGVSQRLVTYVFNGAALDATDNPYQQSNVGLTIDETLCAFDHLEQVNWSAARNAKLLMHGIMAVDYRQTPDEMMQTGVRWAEETLGRFDLPYLVTLHAPPTDGDERNWHLHILWSFRPLVRTGDHEWQVGEMLRTDLDNPAAMKLMRELYAAVMTDVSFEAGQNQVYTAKSNAARGLVHEPQVHLDAADTNRARSGEYVAANEENHERVQRSKAAVLDDDLRHIDEALAKQQDVARAVGARWARLPSLPLCVPERVMAATIPASLPKIAVLTPRCPASIAAAVEVPQPRTIAAHTGDAFKRAAELSPRLPTARLSPDPLIALPPRSSQPAHPKIANLRFTVAPRVRSAIVMPAPPPQAYVKRSVSMTIPAPSNAMFARARTAMTPVADLPARSAQVMVPAIPSLGTFVAPRVGVTVTTPQIPRSVAFATIGAIIPASAPALRFAGLADLDMTISRVHDTRRRHDDQREQERIDADRVTVEAAERAAETERARVALQRLLDAIIEERHYIVSAGDRRIVEPELLVRFGVSLDDVARPNAQQRLAEIAQRQAGELARIGTYLRNAPGDVRKEGSHWVLDEAAPTDVRDLVFAWRNDRQVQAAIARAAAMMPEPAAPRFVDKTAAPDEPGAAWRRAREMRERAMANGDKTKRLDGAGITRPGEPIARPGTPPGFRPAATRRRLPNVLGSGLGD